MGPFVDFMSALGFGKGKVAEKRTLSLIVLSLIVISAVAAADLFLRRPAFDWLFAVAGIVVFAVGFAIRLLGYLNLGRQFTIEVKRVPGHKLVTTGIHKYIRHPMYTGLFLVVIGICIMLQSIAGVIATIVVLAPVGIYRIRIEEAFLLREFGSGYKSYMKKTKRLVPFVW